MYQKSSWSDYTKTYQIFAVPIGNGKTTRKIQFHPASPVIKYHQKSSNSYCLSSLAPAFYFIGNNTAIPALVNSIEESLILQTEKYKDIIHFANTIMKDIRKKKDEHNLRGFLM